MNILSIQLEDYFQVGALKELIDPNQWYRFEQRVHRNVDKTLRLLERHQITATFFVSGWIAERYPEIVRAVAEQGHEIASKGFDNVQRPDSELDLRRFAIAPLKLGQENWPLFFRSCFPHDLASIQRVSLARWFSGGAIRQQIVGGKRPGMCDVRVECENQGRPVLDDSNSRVAMTVNPPLVAFGQAEPPLEIEIVLDVLEFSLADK